MQTSEHTNKYGFPIFQLSIQTWTGWQEPQYYSNRQSAEVQLAWFKEHNIITQWFIKQIWVDTGYFDGAKVHDSEIHQQPTQKELFEEY